MADQTDKCSSGSSSILLIPEQAASPIYFGQDRDEGHSMSKVETLLTI